MYNLDEKNVSSDWSSEGVNWVLDNRKEEDEKRAEMYRFLTNYHLEREQTIKVKSAILIAFGFFIICNTRSNPSKKIVLSPGGQSGMKVGQKVQGLSSPSTIRLLQP